ncbi:MAG: hypothetical protein KIT09_08795 [Bryobacteraceae bacterium]|nr:hypothetical protein [Bryobacteraceae bacterium]
MNRMIAITVLTFTAAALQAAAPFDIVVLSQNQYLGVDLRPIVTAPDQAAFNEAVLAALAQIEANNFEERAEALAREIVTWQPHLVALQEVWDFKRNGANEAAPYRDHLADLMEALTRQGASYQPVAGVRNLSMTIPVDFDRNGAFDALSVTDRDVILARADIAGAAQPVWYSAGCARPSLDLGPGCNYQYVVEAPTALGPIRFERGFVGVDVTVGGKDYRFVNTHLEERQPDPTNPLSPAIQAAQAAELVAVLAATPAGRSLILAGDINSSPADEITLAPLLDPPYIVPPYIQFGWAGLIDTWLLRPGAVQGFTCCQLEDLSNHQSILDERIDMVFTLEAPRKVKARVLGDRVADKSQPSWLWPSDHAAVGVELRFQ